jgi:hypothetical protein
MGDVCLYIFILLVMVFGVAPAIVIFIASIISHFINNDEQ